MPKKSIPDFELPATGGTTFRFIEQRGRPLVIYFYPKDNTPGCTTEGQQFRDSYPQFQQLECAIFGVSRDSLKSHENFKSKLHFPFELLSDADELACKIFEVIKMKNMYGRKVRGIERSTFVFDSNGEMQRAWRGIKVPGHVQEVLDFVKTLR